MLAYASILFITALAGGLAALKLPQQQSQVYRLLLVFAGAYLFAITVTHLLPELLQGSADPHRVGLLVLAGFFLQLILEFLTAGVEHGHVHPPHKPLNESGHDHHHYHSALTPLSLLLALCLHAFLEGTLLLHPVGTGPAHQTDSLLAGIVLHKAPAAFALMSVLLLHLPNKKWAIVMLIIFALASPLGLWFSELMQEGSSPLGALTNWVYPMVAGSFLHISTTIFFENSPDHRFNLRKLAVSFVGAGLGAMVEWIG